jgi:flagellar M-ring protein FliF
MDAMAFLRRTLEQLKTQLAGLSVSNKLLIGLCLLIMVAVAFFTVANSSKPAMVVLIDQPMTPQEINKVEMQLTGKHTYKVDGDKILVPAEDAYAIRGELFAAQALPSDTTMAFEELVKANNLFTTEHNAARQWNVATQETLSRMLKYFPYIESGTVIVVPGERAGIGQSMAPSTASVTVKVRNNEALSSRQVDAIVSMVAGSVSGLKRQNVNVVDGQRSYHVQDDGVAMPTELLELKKAIEDTLTQKLYTMFSEVPNVKIAVNAVPDMRSRTQDSQTYDPKGVVHADISETRHTTNTSDGTAQKSEPGVRPNVGLVADSSNGNHSSSSTSNDTSTSSEARFSKVDEHTQFTPGADLKELTASISLPRSYFVSLYRRMTKDPKADPEDDKLKPVIDEQLKAFALRAKNAIGAQSDDQIRVDWFDDTLAPPPPDVVVAGTGLSAGTVGGLVSQYARQGILAVLALGALGMMLMMVKRAVPAAAGEDLDPSVLFGGAGTGGKKRGASAGQFDTDDDVFGEANSGEAVLTGIELDDDTLASRKMVDEVSTMIKENPENAAALVKRWIAKGK